MNLRRAVILSALLLSACGGNGGTSTTTPTPTPTPPATPSPSPVTPTATVTMPVGASNLRETAFAPNPLSVAIGTVVTFVNNDTTTHDATTIGSGFATGPIFAGRSASVTLATAGSFSYFCTIHPGMTGTLRVQ
jgi:plastocyanin